MGRFLTLFCDTSRKFAGAIVTQNSLSNWSHGSFSQRSGNFVFYVRPEERTALPRDEISLKQILIMKTKLCAFVLAGGLATSAHAAILAGVTGTNNLVTFNSNSPGTYISSNPITGTANGNFITNIAFNSDNGLHYGLDTSANLYRISTNGAAISIVSSLALGSFDAGFDYDPSSGNLVFASLSGASTSVLSPDGSGLMTNSIAYGLGDTNSSATPNLFGIAVDPVFFETYTLDSALGVLGKIIDPAFAEIFTVGSLGLNVTSVGGFASDADGNFFAALSTDGLTTGLYSINTTTGAASSIGSFSDDGVVTLAAVPEPSVSLLAGLAASLMAFRRRRSA